MGCPTPWTSSLWLMVMVLYVTPVPPGARFPEKRAARCERQRAVLVSYADRPGIAGSSSRRQPDMRTGVGEIARRRPIPPTHLNLQGISLFSKKLGSVGGVGGIRPGLRATRPMQKARPV